MAKQPSKKDRFEVLVEQVRSEVQVIADGHVMIVHRLDRTDQKVDRLTERVEFLETAMLDGFKHVNGRMDNMNVRMDGMNVRMDGMNGRLGALVTRFDVHERSHTG